MFHWILADFDLVEQTYNRAAALTKRRFIDLLPVGSSIAPTAPDDPLPFEGQGAHRGVVGFALHPLTQVIGRRPAAPQHAFLGELMEALPLELGTEVTAVDVARLATLFCDRRHPAVALEVGRRVEALAVRAQRRQQPGRQHRPGPRQAGEDFAVGMAGERLSDLSVILLDCLDRVLQLATDESNPQGKTLIEGGLVAKGIKCPVGCSRQIATVALRWRWRNSSSHCRSASGALLTVSERRSPLAVSIRDRSALRSERSRPMTRS